MTVPKTALVRERERQWLFTADTVKLFVIAIWSPVLINLKKRERCK